ncbi:RNA polymerase II mediator complex subunit [Ceratocystis pirilliformis]|uniref:Mediator of RNA polymerase II transcription subunit 10 n=1 Tax=Ceratocystis pirilliformis TaxID=259994 RepID=A0ABR3YTH0_9PEZI
MTTSTNPLHDKLEDQIRNVVEDMFKIMVITANYDAGGRPSKEILATSIKTLDASLQQVYQTASHNANALPTVPPELVQYVEGGRNPEIYTREFVELVHRGNQVMRGKMHAFAQFRDVLADHICVSMPELRDDVLAVVEATGGRAPPFNPLLCPGTAGTQANGQTPGAENGD